MGISMFELGLICMIMLVVLGPERMAEVARKVGQFVGYARRMQRNLQTQLEDELELKKLKDSLPTRIDLRDELGINELESDIRKLTEPDAPSKQAAAPAPAPSVEATAEHERNQ